MHYQKPLDMPTHSMRVEGTIDASILSILVIIYEVDLYKSWWPMILESKVIQEITIYKKYVYLTSWIPFPMQTRDVCLFGSGVDILENDTIVISVHSCEKDFNIAKDEADHDDKNKDEEKKDGGKEEEVNDHHNHLNTPEKTVRMTISLCGIKLVPTSKTKTSVVCIVNCDPKLLVPYWLLNMVTKQFAPKVYETLEALAKKKLMTNL